MGDPDEYLTQNPRGLQITMWFVMGGIGALAVITRLVTTIVQPSTDAQSVAVSSGIFGGLASISGLGLIAGVNSLRHTKRARVAPEGLLIESYAGARFIPWGNVAELRRDKKQSIGDESSREILTLLDARHKSLGKITSDLDRFDELSSRVEALCAAARGAPVLDRRPIAPRRLRRSDRGRSGSASSAASSPSAEFPRSSGAATPGSRTISLPFTASTPPATSIDTTSIA